MDGIAPAFLDGWGHDNEGVRTVFRKAVVEKEFFSDERGDDRFAQADHVGQEESAMFFQQPEPAAHGINLVRKPLKSLGHIRNGIRVVFDAGPKIFEKELIIEFVWGDGGGKVGGVPNFGQKLGEDFHRFRPKTFEFLRRESTHRHNHGGEH